MPRSRFNSAGLKQLLLPLLLVFAACAPGVSGEPEAAAARPNIVWIFVDDMSPNFGVYGETAIATPNVDRMAAEGVHFTDAIMTAPVCSTGRSALVTGMYQTAIGAHNHRSGRGELKIHLPEQVRLVPEMFRDAGYAVYNLTPDDFTRSDAEVSRNPAVKVAKTDYNFEWDESVYGREHWTRRDPEQPFFVQVQLHGGKHRGHGDGEKWPARAKEVLGSNTPVEAVKLPPYLPNDPVILEDWAQYLDTVRYTDWEVGQILKRLEEAGELDNTYIFFLTDHGISHVRNKQFLYDGGIRVPLVVRGPGIQPGSVRTDVVEHIDLGATSLGLAGLEVPEWMQGRDILAADYQPRRFAFAARDRMDETVDRIRAVRDTRYKYLRNYYPERPYLQPNRYKDAKPIVQTMRRLHAAGKLNRDQALVMADTKPVEELYDLEKDPHELRNLADDPAHREVLLRMREALEEWEVATNDHGRTPESAAMYDSDMAEYLANRNANDDGGKTLRRNIALMKRWAAEGK